MGRQLDRQDSDIEFQRHLPGCTWNMFHILDYHYWQGVKKRSPHRRHRRGKLNICRRYPKTISFQQYTDEVQNYLDADADAVPLLDEQQTVQATPGKRVSCKARIKALLAKEMSARSQLQREISVNRLEHSDDLGRITTGWSDPIIILDRSADPATSRSDVPSLPKGSEEFSSEMGDKLVSKSMNHNYSDAKQLSREISHRQFMECMDVLETYKMNKKLFVEIVQNPDVQSATNFHIQLTPARKLRKSGSFPLAVAQHKFLKPITLEHKWKETWSFTKAEKFTTGVDGPNAVASKSVKVTGSGADDCKVSDVTQKSEFSSSVLPQGSIKHGWHQSFMRHLKDVMKKIKHMHKESRNVNTPTSINAFSRVPSRSPDEIEIPERLKEVTIDQEAFHEGNSSDNDFRKVQLPHMRRISSLNESMDRYARLFDYSLTREVKWHKYQSKSLRLTNEDKSARGSGLKSFKRRLSLPDLDSFCPLPNETSHDSVHSGMPTRTGKDYNTNSRNNSHNDLKSVRIEPLDVDLKSVRIEPLDVVDETELQDNILEGDNSSENKASSGELIVSIKEEIADSGDIQEDVVELEEQRNSPCQDQEIGSTMNSSIEHDNQSPVSVLETHFRHDITGHGELLISKVTSVDLLESSKGNSLTGAENEKAENDQKLDDADFNYVREVIDLSGFIEQGYIGTWLSLDQPLSPILFKELEAYLHQELECSPEDDIASNSDHQILFDLINEVLLQIYESSLAYFPKSFSFTQQIRPLPKGNYILAEVWKRISWHRSTGLKIDQSLDDIVSRDLAKDDSWMNIQLDVEDIALDLEDLIFDELIDEVICS